MVQGLRPGKPANAPAIGLSESLWNFVQRCWDQDRYSRPRVADVVMHLAGATTNWHGLMPPCSAVENVTPASEEAMSNSMQHSKPKIYIPPRYWLLNRDTDRIFGQTSTNAPGGPDSRASSLFGRNGPPSMVFAESPREEAQEIVTKPPAETLTGRPGALRRREVPDDLAEARHLTYDSQPPPAALPPRKKGYISKRLKNALFPMFRQPVLSSKLPGLAKVATESRRRPNQDLIDRVDRVFIIFKLSPSRCTVLMQTQMLENAVYDHDWHRLLNILCKTCSNLRTLPKSMYVGDCLEGESDEKNHGGQAKVFKGKYKGRAVAVKVPHLSQSSDLDKCLRVSMTTPRSFSNAIDVAHRNSVEKL